MCLITVFLFPLALLVLPFPSGAITQSPQQLQSSQNQTSSPYSFSFSPHSPFQTTFHFDDEDHPQNDQPPEPVPLSLPIRSRGESTIRIGTGRNKNGTGSSRSRPSWRQEKTTTESSTPETSTSSVIKEPIYAGLILPHFIYHRRGYFISVNKAMDSLKQNSEFKSLFENHFRDEPAQHLLIRMLTLFPSPRDILTTLCHEFLASNVSAIIYLTNNEVFGATTAASQYLLQLSGYLGLPVIAWNADNSGLRRRATSMSTDFHQTEMVLQLAPSIHHQAAAMISILTRYNWHQFAIVTSQIAGHDDFVQAVRDHVQESQFKFVILQTVLVLSEQDLAPLVSSEARILLLYCTQEEAKWIMRTATNYGLTGSNYVWIVTQSVIEQKLKDISSYELPIGMLGVHFNTTIEALKSEIINAIRVFVHGVHQFRNDSRNNKISLSPSLSCDGVGEKAKWGEGDHFYRALSSVVVDTSEGKKPPLTFNPDGTLENVELKIMNLRPLGSKESSLVWEQIGLWRSWRKADDDSQLDIKDIVWPGKSHKPPDGVPEKFHLKITFLEEAPYIKMTDPDPVTGRCSPDRGVLCKINNNSMVDSQHNSSPNVANRHLGSSLHQNNISIDNSTFLKNYQCCSGFNIDLLVKFAEDIGFTYELVRVPDGKWGTNSSHKWNGMIGELINRRCDVALASLMINSEREAVVDFSVPYMDSGIAIMTAKRTGIISPTAFLEPFDPSLWFLICVVGIQMYSLFIFFFEWISPLGFDMKKYPTPGSRFSFFRSCWLVWARLFQASVHVEPPRGFTAKFLVYVWSMFAVVFLATYTANLAVFMITREESHQFRGVHDSRLSNPYSVKPPMKFGTVWNTHTANLISKHHPEMFHHMTQYNVMNVSEGVNAVRNEKLDAFIYDGPVLQYEVFQDTSETCQLLIEGAWYAHTGYGLAFPRNSKYLPQFNKYLMEYKENGDLERLRRFYFTGPCSVERGQSQPTSIGKFNTFGTGPLALEQFLSVFLLLGIGVCVACVFVLIEKAYANCIVKSVFGANGGGGDGFKKSQQSLDMVEHKSKKAPPACLQLLSQNMGLPYSRTFYRAHKRDSKIRLLDHITSSFNMYDNPSNTITDHYHGFLESFVLRKMITCNDPICQRNFVKLEGELRKCLMKLKQIETWGRLYGDNRMLGPSAIRSGTFRNPNTASTSLMRTRISTIERNHDEIVGRRICGDYSDYSDYSIVGTATGTGVGANVGVSGGVSSAIGGLTESQSRGMFRDEVIGSVSSSSAALRKRSGSFGSKRELRVSDSGGDGLRGIRVSVSDMEDDVISTRSGAAGRGVSRPDEVCGVSTVFQGGRFSKSQEQIIKVAEIETVL